MFGTRKRWQGGRRTPPRWDTGPRPSGSNVHPTSVSVAYSVLPHEPLSYTQTISRRLVHSPCLSSVPEEGWMHLVVFMQGWHGRGPRADGVEACAAFCRVRSSGPGGAFAWWLGWRLPRVRLTFKPELVPGAPSLRTPGLHARGHLPTHVWA